MHRSDNPFEAPTTDGFVLPAPEEQRLALADPGKRFLGNLVDNILAWLLPGFVAVTMGPDSEEFLGVFYAALAPSVMIQAALITTRGQSVGKMLVKTKIVDMQGGPCGFVRGVLVRSWVAAGLHFIPLFGLIDALFVFREDHRTIHDLIAGTKVVDVSFALEEMV